MEKERIIKKIKIVGSVLVGVLIVWVFILNPFIKFKSNENKMLKASKRYFEVNSNELPTGNRVKTIYLKELYSKAFLKDDLYIPLSKKSCSITESFVKVRHENGEYKYYTYLKCGVLSSMGDHEGPEIVLNGKDTITVDKGSKYTELGVKNLKDNKDGKMDVSNVVINSKDVNTKKLGTYEVTYTAFDSLSNKTVKTRTVKVVSRLKNVVKKATNNLGYYKGEDPNNYIYFSGMLFRIVGIDNGNVKIIADQDVSNINYDGIDKWLDYYYDHLTDNSKKFIVENKYCNMKLTDNDINTTKCTSYTDKKKVYIISADEVNKSIDDVFSFLKPESVSWIANKYDDNEAYTTRAGYDGSDLDVSIRKFNSTFNYGIRPVITIKGAALVKSGKGTKTKPYNLGDVKRAKVNDLLNTRPSGEYVKYSGYLWQIIEVDNDGTTKVTSDRVLKDDESSVTTFYDVRGNVHIYNTKQKGNIGYYIKNKIGEFVKLDYFVEKNIKVPIYKNKFAYQKEIETKTYKTKLSVPNMYEMFSAYDFSNNEMEGYWYINSSKTSGMKAAMSHVGVPFNQKLGDVERLGVKPVGYLNKNITITNGKGTKNNPYIISK